MIWLKAFHIVFVVAWFAGVFYLPRLFIYHAAETNSDFCDRLKIMERRLFAMMTICALLAIAFGAAMIMLVPTILMNGWMQAKLVLVLALAVHYVICWRLLIAFRENRNSRSQLWLRFFNEAPLIVLIGVVVLVVVKPF